jgi:hypothetical protein
MPCDPFGLIKNKNKRLNKALHKKLTMWCGYKLVTHRYSPVESNTRRLIGSQRAVQGCKASKGQA